ncbi:MAG: hypothetical protein CW335_07115 [Clostridiales bacterium]|nr:hypothetical protein [Clostridiales bacterium]
MKKWPIAALLILLVVLIAVSAVLILRFVTLYSSRQSDAPQEAEKSADIEAYVKENWSGYDCSFDSASQVLTLTQNTPMLYDDVCTYGGSVYSDDLAPESFQHDAASVAIDVASHCNAPSLSVTLCYLSSDNKPIFTVSSDGDIWTCWKTEAP